MCGSVSRTAAEVAFEIRDYGAGRNGRSRQPIKRFLYQTIELAGAMAEQLAQMSFSFTHPEKTQTCDHHIGLHHHAHASRQTTKYKLKCLSDISWSKKALRLGEACPKLVREALSTFTCTSSYTTYVDSHALLSITSPSVPLCNLSIAPHMTAYSHSCIC